MTDMRTRLLSRTVVAVAAVAGAMTISAGGTGLAINDPRPAFGKQLFVMLEGRLNTNRTAPDITLDCAQNGAAVMHDRKSAAGGGAFFTLGPTQAWASGGAICTARLVAASKRGDHVDATLSFAVSGAVSGPVSG
jgi:hypothetical protein